MGDFQSSPERLRIEDFQSFNKGLGFLDFLDWIEDFFQPLPIPWYPLKKLFLAQWIISTANMWSTWWSPSSVETLYVLWKLEIWHLSSTLVSDFYLILKFRAWKCSCLDGDLKLMQGSLSSGIRDSCDMWLLNLQPQLPHCSFKNMKTLFRMWP